jgi:hypothetical protein
MSEHPPKQQRTKGMAITQAIDAQIRSQGIAIVNQQGAVEHTKMMIEQLKEEKQTTKDTAKMGVDGVTQWQNHVPLLVAQIDKAIAKKKKFETKQQEKLNSAKAKLHRLQNRRHTMVVRSLKREEMKKFARLKKWSREKVDFNLWRANHPVQDNSRTEWKLTKKVKFKERAEKTKVDRIKETIAAQLRRKVKAQTVEVKHKVADSLKQTAAGRYAAEISRIIKLKAGKAKNARVHRIRVQNEKVSEKLQNRGNQEEKRLAMILATEKTASLKFRKKLESTRAKQRRLDSDAIARQVMRQKAHHEAPFDATDAKYLLYTATGKGSANPYGINAAQSKRLSMKVKESEAKDAIRVQVRDKKFDAFDAAESKSEAQSMKLENVRLRTFEMKAKLASIKKMQVAHNKLAAVKKSDAAEKMKTQVKAKKLDDKLTFAKKGYIAAKLNANGMKAAVTTTQKGLSHALKTPKR